MTDELRKPILVNYGTLRTLTLEVYEERSQTFSINTATFELLDDDKVLVVSGNASVDETATDEAGRTIKIVSADIDFSESWAAVGRYRLHFLVTTPSSEGSNTDVVSAVVDVVEFRS